MGQAALILLFVAVMTPLSLAEEATSTMATSTPAPATSAPILATAAGILDGVLGTTIPKVPITGTYQLSKSENFWEYMTALGVGFFTKTLANAATPVTNISKDGDEYTMKTDTTFKTTIIKFKLGEQFDEITGDDRQCKSTITMESDTKMLHKQLCGTGEFKIEREFSDKEMKMLLYAPGVVSTRMYTRL